MANPAPSPPASLYYPTAPPRRRRPTVGNLHYRVAAILVALLVFSAVFIYALETSHTSLIPPRSHDAPALDFPTPITHLIVIFMENHGRSDVLANGPFEKYISQRYASAANFHGMTYDSLADYMYATSGSFTTGSASVSSVPQLIDNAKKTWAAYMQSMPTPCDTGNTSLYTPNHNPFVHYTYVTASASYCASHVLGLDAWNQSIASGTLPNYVFISPDLVNDSDNISASIGDAWLHGFLSPFLNSSLFATSAVIVTYDSDAPEGGMGNPGNGVIYLALLSPFAHFDYTSTSFYDDFDLLTTTEWLLGLGSTKHSDNWAEVPPMTDLFNFNPTYTLGGTVKGQGGVLGDALVSGSGYSVRADALGTYSIPLPNGTYIFTASPPDGACTSNPTMVTVPGANVSLNFDLPCA